MHLQPFWKPNLLALIGLQDHLFDEQVNKGNVAAVKPALETFWEYEAYFSYQWGGRKSGMGRQFPERKDEKNTTGCAEFLLVSEDL